MTAGPTREAIDPARFLSNASSGKMGYALAAEAARRGARVTLVSGPTSLTPPAGVNLVHVTSAEEMFRAALNQAISADIVVKAAAVADYRPEIRARAKLKKETLRRRGRRTDRADRSIDLRLVATPDILEELGRRKPPGQTLIGFAAETDHLERNARLKLQKKNLDMIVANRIGAADEGFASDFNRALVIDRHGEMTRLPLMRKDELAAAILDLGERLLPPGSAAHRPGERR